MTPAQIGEVLDGPKADTIRIKVTDREPHVARVMGGQLEAMGSRDVPKFADVASAIRTATIAARRAQ